MSLKSFIVPRIAERLFNEKRLYAQRAKFERNRKSKDDPLTIEFFHDPSDPYSQLLKQILPQFTDKYRLDVTTHLVSPPNDAAAPERKKLIEYARMDAMRLSKKAGIALQINENPPATHTEEADSRRENLGHYLGGMLYYGNEWYWGLDRLHHLENRLKSLGYWREAIGDNIYEPPIVPESTGNTDAEIHWYLSFRSPYTAIVRDRVKALADAYNAKLNLRFVLPMVMRGLPVPPAKKKYIPFDTAREARRLGVKFGRILDPVGKPVEIGYSLLPWAREHGRGYEYVQSWLTGVWAEGIDVGSSKGLRKVVERAGLNWGEAKDIVGNDDWRAEAEANRLEMMDRGIWGVPSFRVGDTITWGQDRLWVIEHALQKLSKEEA